MKLGDSGTILSSQTQDSTRLCLFKFYPSNNCKIRFSCDTFVVSSGYNSGSCPSKVIQSFICTSKVEDWLNYVYRGAERRKF